MIRGSRPGKPDRNGLPELSRRYVYRGRKRGRTPQEIADDATSQRYAQDVASGRRPPPESVSRETSTEV